MASETLTTTAGGPPSFNDPAHQQPRGTQHLAPAIASIVAAILAARSAKRTTAQGNRTERERRLAERRVDVYRPFLKLLQSVFDQAKDPDAGMDQAEMITVLGDLGTQLSLYGSDEAIQTFHRFMQGAYADAPPRVAMRHYYDLLMAARRDIEHPDTEIGSLDSAGFRITDLYEGDFREAFT